jgi:hypothetical protein
MAHFAQVNEDFIVTRVIVVNNEDCKDENGNESEAVGVAFCKSLYGDNTFWVQTSYNGNIRYNFAGIGYKFDLGLDGFVPPKPYPSWELADNCVWWPPIPMPNDGKKYEWDEPTTSWVEIT